MSRGVIIYTSRRKIFGIKPVLTAYTLLVGLQHSCYYTNTYCTIGVGLTGEYVGIGENTEDVVFAEGYHSLADVGDTALTCPAALLEVTAKKGSLGLKVVTTNSEVEGYIAHLLGTHAVGSTSELVLVAILRGFALLNLPGVLVYVLNLYYTELGGEKRGVELTLGLIELTEEYSEVGTVQMRGLVCLCTKEVGVAVKELLNIDC